MLEQLRRRRISRSPSALTADYFVWATGEGPHRAMTKLGGIPCLPASMPWPRRSGTIGDFYAQLSFVDSKDLVPSLPGDVLLVFRFHDLAHVNSWCEELYAFLWVDAEEHQWIAPQDVQRSRAGAAAGSWPTLHGCRVRTFDDPGQLAALLAKGHGDVDLLIGEATKIGGAATDCQSVRPPNVPADWRFLGQVTSTWPATGVPFPFVDRSTPICGPDDAGYERTVSGPGSGILCLYLDGQGDVRVFFSDS